MRRIAWCVVIFFCSTIIVPVLGWLGVSILVVIGAVCGVVSFSELLKILTMWQNYMSANKPKNI